MGLRCSRSRRVRVLSLTVVGACLAITAAPLMVLASGTTAPGATGKYKQVWERLAPFTSSTALPAGYGTGSTFCETITGTVKKTIVTGTNLSASYDNVYACGPALGTSWSNDLIEPDFQCVELSARFLWDAYGLRASVASGGTFVSSVHSQFPGIPVGTPGIGSVPAPGDIVSLSGGPSADPSGHTAVVTRVNIDPFGNGTATVMEQNGISTGWDQINVAKWAETFGDPLYDNAYYYYPNVSWVVLNSNHAPGVANAPAAVADAAGDQYLAWKGTDSNLWSAYWNGTTWSGPTRVGMGPLGSTPSLVYRPSTGEVDAFWKGTDANLWEAVHTSSGWSGPFYRGMGPLGSPPTAAALGSEVDVFWKGADAGLWTATASGSTWGGPRGLGMGPLGSRPTASFTSFGVEDVFWSGTDNFLWEAARSASAWSGPTSQGLGPLGTPPFAQGLAGGAMSVSWEGWDGGIWMVTSSASGWQPLEVGMAPLGSAPAITAWSAGVAAFWRGTDANIWAATQVTSGTWNGPTVIGMGPLG